MHIIITVFALTTIMIFSGVQNFAYANPDGQDIWGLTANTSYVDLRTVVTCNSDLTFYGGDSDNDGICDHWEDGTFGNGLHIRVKGTSYTYDLSCDPNATYSTDPTGYTVCPKPNHKDIYVELDWMQGHAPSPTAIADVTNAFNKSPVTNGDGTNGVNLHIQYGEDPANSDGNTGVHVTNLKVSTALASTNSSPNFGFWVLKENRFGTIAERTTTDPNHGTFCSNGESWFNCGSAKRQVFHYAVYIHKQYEAPTSSGWSEIFGNDFVMSLAALSNPGVDEQEASLMHELGHNLNLYHSGARPPDINGNGKYDSTDDAASNCKPNYLSVMSYTYEFRSTADLCRPLDFENIKHDDLNEANLTDDNGVSSDPYPSTDPDPPGATQGTCNNAAHNGQERPIWYSTPSGSIVPSTTNTPQIDWNGDGLQSGSSYTNANINNLSTISGCGSTNQQTLTGHNDWTGGDMIYNFRTSALVTSSNATIADTCENCPESLTEPSAYSVPPVPDTTIDTTPSNPSGNDASFTFHSSIQDSTFECQLDNGVYSVCSSPQSYNNLPSGSHTFMVRGISSGMQDPTPASYTWQVGQDWALAIIGIIAAIASAIIVPITVKKRR